MTSTITYCDAKDCPNHYEATAANPLHTSQWVQVHISNCQTVLRTADLCPEHRDLFERTIPLKAKTT